MSNKTVPPWTKGEWIPEHKSIYNPEAKAYQTTIVGIDKEDRTIAAFAMGETKKQCEANSWLLAASKDLLRCLQDFMKDRPTITDEEIKRLNNNAHIAISKALYPLTKDN